MTASTCASPATRRGMDVFSAYQNQYIGTVIEVMHRGGDIGGPQGSGPNPTGSERRTDGVSLIHEEGNIAEHAEHPGERRLGEDMGPVPTSGFGNTGPMNQSAARGYGTRSAEVSEAVFFLVVRPGRLNLGPLTRPLYVPGAAVSSISMDRIVLDVQREDIPIDWNWPPVT